MLARSMVWRCAVSADRMLAPTAYTTPRKAYLDGFQAARLPLIYETKGQCAAAVLGLSADHWVEQAHGGSLIF